MIVNEHKINNQVHISVSFENLLSVLEKEEGKEKMLDIACEIVSPFFHVLKLFLGTETAISMH